MSASFPALTLSSHALFAMEFPDQDFWSGQDSIMSFLERAFFFRRFPITSTSLLIFPYGVLVAQGKLTPFEISIFLGVSALS